MKIQLEDRNKLAEKTEDNLKYSGEAMRTKEMIINEFKTKNEKLERKLMECCSEINKGNEIIESLKKDLSRKKESIKTKNDVIKMQEAKISHISDEVNKLKGDMIDVQRGQDVKDREISSLGRVIDDLNNKLKQSDKTNEESQSCIR